MTSHDVRPSTLPTEPVDVIVVGAGLAGLSAASFAARAGASVAVLDARHEIGGRARTATQGGFRFNQGPHALYRGGAGAAALRELGIRPSGRVPQVGRSFASMHGTLTRRPGRAAVAGLLRVLAAARRDRDDPALASISSAEWLTDRSGNPDGFALSAALARLTTYASRLDEMSADAVVEQILTSLRGVVYLDDGWAQLVELLRYDATRRVGATGAAATIVSGVKAGAIDADVDGVTVSTDAGEMEGSAVVIAAGGPSTASHLVRGRSGQLVSSAARADPILAATLDAGFGSPADVRCRGVLGVDRPTYAFFHTPSARLADGAGEVAHVMAYEPDAALDADRIDALLDSIATELMPGWRAHVDEERRGRRLVVATDRPHVGSGLAGRPTPEVADLDRTFVAGDWVGRRELLAGASLASGRAAGIAAAGRALSSAPRRPAPAGGDGR